MRNGIINAGSPKEDVWGMLTGVWNEYAAGLNGKWKVCKTPFFLHMEAVLEAGRNELPMAPNSTKALYWTAKDSSGSVVINAGETGFDLPENAYCEITIFGTGGGNDGH